MAEVCASRSRIYQRHPHTHRISSHAYNWGIIFYLLHPTSCRRLVLLNKVVRVRPPGDYMHIHSVLVHKYNLSVGCWTFVQLIQEQIYIEPLCRDIPVCIKIMTPFGAHQQHTTSVSSPFRTLRTTNCLFIYSYCMSLFN